MATDTKERYSDAELEEFRVIIQQKIDKAQNDLDLIKSAYMNDGNNGTDDTSPTFKAFEEGSETMSKEENSEKGGSIGYFGGWPAEGGKFEEIWEEITKFPLVFYRKIVNFLSKSSKFSPAAG